MLLLGVGGRTVYSGPAKQALPYFFTLGFTISEGENPADFLMDVISGVVPRYDPRYLGIESVAIDSDGGDCEFGRGTTDNVRGFSISEMSPPKLPFDYQGQEEDGMMPQMLVKQTCRHA